MFTSGPSAPEDELTAWWDLLRYLSTLPSPRSVSPHHPEREGFIPATSFQTGNSEQERQERKGGGAGKERGGMRHSEAVMIKPEPHIFMRQAGNLKRPSARGWKPSQLTDLKACNWKRSEARRVGGILRGLDPEKHTHQVVWKRVTNTHTLSQMSVKGHSWHHRLPWWRHNPVEWRFCRVLLVERYSHHTHAERRSRPARSTHTQTQVLRLLTVTLKGLISCESVSLARLKLCCHW